MPDKEKGRLSGKVAIVTGSGQGIGKGIALRLAQEGAEVVVADYNPETAEETASEIKSLGRRSLSYPVDISNVSQLNQMADDTVTEFGHVDILINNAGTIQIKPMMDVTEEDWDRVIDLNMRGTFFCLQAVARKMIERIPEELKAAIGPVESLAVPKEGEGEKKKITGCWGKILSLSSISGRSGRPTQVHYAASKAAVISITQSAALALAPYRINVNAIAPGVVNTPMWEGIDRDRAKLLKLKPGEAMANIVKTVPINRVSTPDDLAGAIIFLCSSDADYITGQTLNVDGGFAMN